MSGQPLNKKDITNIDQHLRVIAQDLQHCRAAKKTIAGMVELGGAIGPDTLAASVALLHTAACRLEQSACALVEQLGSLSLSPGNGELRDTEETA